MDISDELAIAAQHERHGGRARVMIAAAKEILRLRRFAGFVCELDWSENDEDAVQRIDDLRKVIAEIVVAS